MFKQYQQYIFIEQNMIKFDLKFKTHNKNTFQY